MAVPYFPHVTRVVISVQVEGHQVEYHSHTLTMTKERHGSEACKEAADAALSIISLVPAMKQTPAGGGV
jgi:hypothetical protein